jgi:hypothetical protein
MEVKIFGQKLRVEIIILSMLVGAFIAMNMWCSCAGGFLEGFAAGTELVGAALNYSIGDGVPISWEAEDTQNITSNTNSIYEHLDANKGSPVPLQEGELFMFSKNKFDSSCCPSTYSNSMGCACLSTEQAKYLNERGGNRTLTTIF